MDLGEIDLAAAAEAGADLTVRHPVTGEPTDVVIRLLGVDSPTFRQAQRLQIDAFAKSQRPEPSVTRAQLLAAVTVSWDNVMLDGADLAFSSENAVKLYTHPRASLWLAPQVDQFISARANFSKG